MDIPVVVGVGHGSTPLSTFDDARRACGVLNSNLIPPSALVVAMFQAQAWV